MSRVKVHHSFHPPLHMPQLQTFRSLLQLTVHIKRPSVGANCSVFHVITDGYQTLGSHQVKPQINLCLILCSALPYLTSTSINDSGEVKRGVVVEGKGGPITTAVFDRLGAGSDWALARHREGKSRRVPSSAPLGTHRLQKRNHLRQCITKCKIKIPQRQKIDFAYSHLNGLTFIVQDEECA